VNITDIIPTDMSGYCDVESGECTTAETGTNRGAPTEHVTRTDHEIPPPKDPAQGPSICAGGGDNEA
jgi:hypothetical protein